MNNKLKNICLSLSAIALTHAISSHNDYLILCISNCKIKKRITNGLVLYNIIFNMLVYISKKLESI